MWGAGVNIEDCPCEPMLPVISHSHTHTHTPTSQLNTAVVSSGSAIQETLATEQEIFRDDSSPFSHLGDMPVDQAKPSLSEMPLMARRITAPVEDQD